MGTSVGVQDPVVEVNRPYNRRGLPAVTFLDKLLTKRVSEPGDVNPSTQKAHLIHRDMTRRVAHTPRRTPTRGLLFVPTSWLDPSRRALLVL